MSKLLIDCTPLMALPPLAALVGINEALAAQQIHWVVYTKTENEDYRTLHDGFIWCAYTLKQWQKKLPWLSCSGIRKILKNLERHGIVISCQPNARLRDQTKWYRVDTERISAIEQSGVKSFIDVSESDNSDVSESDNSDVSESDNSDVSESDNSSLLKRSSKRSLKKEEKKDADFVSSEIRDLKNRALDEENINSTSNAKNQEDPIPPTPLSQSPENHVKQYPDPMGDRFRAKKSRIVSEWTGVLSDATAKNPIWFNLLEPWADVHFSNKDLEPHFKKSLIDVTMQHLKNSSKPALLLDAQGCLLNYIRQNKVTDFRKRIQEAEGIEEADRRLEVMQITKPECTTTYWYLWRAAPRESGIFWKMYPQQEDASEQGRKDIQSRVLDELIVKLSDQGLMHLAISNDKHFLAKGSAGIDLFPKMIADLGLYLQIQAQNYQGVAA